MDNLLAEVDVRRILHDLYDIVPKSIREILGFHCKNFVINMDEEATTSETMATYILKIFKSENHSVCENLDLQHAMQRHLASDGIVTSQPLVTKHGQTVGQYGNGEKEYTVQLLTFLNGKALVDVSLTKHDMKTLALKIGNFIGKIHKSLRNLEFDTSNFTGANDHRPENALAFRKNLCYVTDKNIRSMLEEFFDLYEKNVLPKLKSLRRVFSHCDISNGNLIVRKAKEWEIVGLIDFEDSYLGFVVGDLGICFGYLLMQVAFVAESDVVDVSTRAIRAYEEIFPLESDEKDILYEMITSRIVVSYLTGCEKAHFDPENSEFWFRQSLYAPATLQRIREIGRENLKKAWFGPCLEKAIA